MSGLTDAHGEVTVSLKILNIQKQFSFFIMKSDLFEEDLIIGLNCIKEFRLCQNENLEITQSCSPRLENENFKCNQSLILPIENNSNVLNDLLKKYDSVFAKEKFDIGTVKNFEATIRLTENKYVSRKPYKCSIPDKIEIETQIKKLLKAGLIEESYSPYASPVTLVYKKEEGKKSRLCIDYRELNKIVVPEGQPFPRIDDLVVRVGKCVYFSKLDINSAFWSIPLRAKDKYKTAFVTHHGHWQWACLPFGLKSAPAIFQRILSSIIRNNNLDSFAINYIDDILIFSNNYSDHLQHIKRTLQVLQEQGLKLNTNKCCFAQREVTYLGHRISNNSIKPINDNLIALKDFPEPKTRKNIRQFLGKVNFYLKYIPRSAMTLEPLHNLLRKNVKFVWSDECKKSFEEVKEYLCTTPVLAIFDPNKPIYIYTDASIEGVGAILKQPQEDESVKPVFYFSRKLNKSQKAKRAIYIECLAIKEAILYWQYYLIGQRFKIFTDHEPLRNFNIKNCKDIELLHILNFISQFEFEIQYNPGINNTEADCLSRNPVLSEENDNYKSQIKIVNYLTVQNILENQKQLKFDKYCKIKNKIIYRTLNKREKVWLTEDYGITLLKKIHDSHGHIGVKQMILTITPTFYFKNMHKHIKIICKTCETCIKNKTRVGNFKAPLSQLGPASVPLEIVSLDTIGGFTGNRSPKKYLHLMVDQFTRFAFISTSKTQSARDFINLVKSTEKKGDIKTIFTDQYPGINSSEFKNYLKHKNINLIFTAIDCAFSNGQNERTNQTLVNRIRCKIYENKNKPWSVIAEQCISDYNNTIHTSTGFSPNYLLTGKDDSIIPTELNKNTLENLNFNRSVAIQNSNRSHNINKKYYDKHTKDIEYKENDLVYIQTGSKLNRNKLDPVRIGPFKIKKKISNSIYEIDFGRKKRDLNIFHKSKMIPYSSYPYEFSRGGGM